MSYILYDPEAPVIAPRKPKRDCAKIVLTDEQQQWLRDNYATTLNKGCAAHLGVSLRTVVRLARKMGLEKDPAWLLGVFMERQAMMVAANRGDGNAGKANLLKYGRQYQFRKGVTCRERLGDERERQRIEKSVASRRDTLRKERMRVNWGLEQQTKLKIGHSKPKAQLRYALKKRGYVIPFKGANEVLVTSTTSRSPIIERHARERGITILLLHEGNIQVDRQGCIDNVNPNNRNESRPH